MNKHGIVLIISLLMVSVDYAISVRVCGMMCGPLVWAPKALPRLVRPLYPHAKHTRAVTLNLRWQG